MTIALRQTRYTARMAATPAEVGSCQALRHASFFGHDGLDRDAFDNLCQHLMVLDRASGDLVATTRVAYHATGAEICHSYAAQSYDLTGLSLQPGRFAEIGRFCLRGGPADADILRTAWAALTRFVDANQIALLFGCSSFAGTDPAPYTAALATLHARHLGPVPLRPAIKAAEAFPLCSFAGDARAGLAQMPPLLTSYLKMGGWVSDHAVVDHAMNTLHVFTALPIADVPPVRAKALRALAQMI